MALAFPDILLVCEDPEFTQGFSAMVQSAYPDSDVHCIHPDNPAAWDDAIRRTQDHPRVAFIGLKTGSAKAALSLRTRPNSKTVPWIILLHPSLQLQEMDHLEIPYAKVRINWFSEDRDREVRALLDFLETCVFP